MSNGVNKAAKDCIRDEFNFKTASPDEVKLISGIISGKALGTRQFYNGHKALVNNPVDSRTECENETSLRKFS